jgi:hypothetical protein
VTAFVRLRPVVSTFARYPGLLPHQRNRQLRTHDTSKHRMTPPEQNNQQPTLPRSPSRSLIPPLSSLRSQLLQLPLQRLPKIKHPIFHPSAHIDPRLDPLRPVLPYLSSTTSILFTHLNPTPPCPRLRIHLYRTLPLRAYQHRLFTLLTNIIRIDRTFQLRLILYNLQPPRRFRTRRLREHQSHWRIRRVHRDSRKIAPRRERACKEGRDTIVIRGTWREDTDCEALRRGWCG